VATVAAPSPASSDRPLTGFGRFLWSAGPALFRLVGHLAFSLRVERFGPLPSPPFVLAANHYSHFDPPAIGAVLGTPVRYLAVDELFGASRIFDTVLTGFGAIPVSRTRLPISTIRVALARLDAGEVVGVFPEGRRVPHWGSLEPRRGAAWLAVRTGVPLVPVAVLGTGRVFGMDNSLRLGPIRIVIGGPMPPDGEDATTLTARWAGWMSEQVARFPALEPPQ